MSAGINLYAYVNNNPLIYIDPEGLTYRKIREGLSGDIPTIASEINKDIINPSVDYLTGKVDLANEYIDYGKTQVHNYAIEQIIDISSFSIRNLEIKTSVGGTVTGSSFNTTFFDSKTFLDGPNTTNPKVSIDPLTLGGGGVTVSIYNSKGDTSNLKIGPTLGKYLGVTIDKNFNQIDFKFGFSLGAPFVDYSIPIGELPINEPN